MYKDELLRSMHKVVRKDPLTGQLTGSIGLTLDNFDDSIADFKNQLDIDKATWAIPIYEAELGLTIDISRTLDARRSDIKAKLRGQGKIGAAEIKLVADSYTNGDVDVSFENGVVIEFTSVIGTPPDMEDVQKALRNVVPAHLSISYKFRFLLINEIDSVMTLSELETVTLDKFAGGA